MKIKRFYYLTIFVTALFIQGLVAQPPSEHEVHDFALRIVVKNNKLEVSCERSCSWVKVNYNVKNDDSLLISKEGVVDEEYDPANGEVIQTRGKGSGKKNNAPQGRPSPAQSDFLIRFRKEGNLLHIYNIRGARWQHLTFEVRNKDVLLLDEDQGQLSGGSPM